MSLETVHDVLDFWTNAGTDKWFTHDPEFDESVRREGEELHQQATGSKLASWEESPEGALALIIVLDQFSRNMFRGSPRAYAADAIALAAAERAIDRGFDEHTPAPMRHWFYLPFMHAEDRHAQERCVELFAFYPKGKHWAQHHERIIRRFGRFPHRNEILGRESTPEELAYLEQDDFRG